METNKALLLDALKVCMNELRKLNVSWDGRAAAMAYPQGPFSDKNAQTLLFPLTAPLAHVLENAPPIADAFGKARRDGRTASHPPAATAHPAASRITPAWEKGYTQAAVDALWH